MKITTANRSFRPEADRLETREVLSTLPSFTAFPTASFGQFQLTSPTLTTTVGVHNPAFNAGNVNLTYGLKGMVAAPSPFASIVNVSPYFSAPNINLNDSPTTFPFYTGTTTPTTTVGVHNPPFNAGNVNLTYGLKSFPFITGTTTPATTTPATTTPVTTTPTTTVGVHNPPFNAGNVNLTYGLKGFSFVL